MGKLIGTIIFMVAVAWQVEARAQTPMPIPVDELGWTSPAVIPGLSFAWVLGAQSQSQLYVLRVKLQQGTVIPPHTHPDERHSTVLSGTLYVGFGDHVKDESLVAIEAGNVYIVPAGVVHFLMAKDGSVEYQESGMGPTSTEIIAN